MLPGIASRSVRCLVLLSLTLSWSACRLAPGDDDDSAVSDDDDSSPVVPPLAELLGVFNLTNVVRSESDSYVDFSGALGSFAALETETFSPTAYLGSFNFSADAVYWLPELGSYPLPPLGGSVVVDVYEYFPWSPEEQLWWDGGPRIGLGSFLSTRLELDDVLAYQVDDPFSPGAAGWEPGARLDWQNSGGEDVVGLLIEGGVTLPAEVVVEQPISGVVAALPVSQDLQVNWLPQDDGAAVSVLLWRDSRLAYVASVADQGTHSIPSAVLEAEFGPGPAELVVARTLTSRLGHPQGDIDLRARQERRLQVELLPDLVLAPAYGEPGQTFGAVINWYSGSFDGVTVEVGQLDGTGTLSAAGVTVLALVPERSDPSSASLQLQISSVAAPGPRHIRITGPGGTVDWPDAFTVLDLLPSNDCLAADAIAPLSAGSYSSTTASLSNTHASGYSCLPWSLNGRDSVYRLDLQEGQMMVATLQQAGLADGALALLSACGLPASAVGCADAGLSGEPEVLTFIADTSGTYYLVVDSYVGVGATATASGGPFELELEISTPALRPGWIVPGQTRSFVLSRESGWGGLPAPGDLSFGAGLSVAAVTAGVSPEQLLVEASASSQATPGPRDLSVSGVSAQVLEFPQVLHVSGWPSYDSCAEAVLAPSSSSNSALGYGVQTRSRVDSVPCLDWDSTGPELFIPLDMAAGGRLDVSALSDEDLQLYILADCQAPESCIEGAAVDATVAGEAEYIEGWSPPQAGRYYLVVDMYSPPLDPLLWEYQLTLALQ